MNRILITALLIVWGTLSLLTPGCRRSTQEPSPPASSAPAKATIVGHQVCAECHTDISEAHHASGHSRTFALAKDSEAARKLCGITLTDQAPYGTYQYSCDAEGLVIENARKFPGRLMPVDYALGSGTHAVTFVTLTSGRTGEPVGLEHRMSWYASDDRFDITPSHQEKLPTADGEFFGLMHSATETRKCIGCHITQGTVEKNGIRDLYGGVHCERCHGPASDHVAAARQGDSKRASELIRNNWTAQEEVAMCGECHRTREDITPERFNDYPLSLVRFQPVGLVKSKCYQASPESMRCTTCHDPHGPPSSRTMEQQVASCVACHEQPGHKICTVSPKTDCIRCHMPAIDLIRGIKFHDHWIRIRDDKPDEIKSGNLPFGPPPEQGLLKSGPANE